MSQPKPEILVLVDEHDNQVGTDTRENCHRGRGRRHRAYVVFLFHEGRLLLQRRSLKKTLWPGAWDVSFTSHVYPGETYYEAAKRKGVQELDATFGPLEDVYSYVYFAPQGDWAENEFCRLLVGEFDGRTHPNPDEIMETRYATLQELAADLKARPDVYTPWLKLAFEGYVRSPAFGRHQRA
jgi:isopentenyl-diphosphate Delta-isomerase